MRRRGTRTTPVLTAIAVLAGMGLAGATPAVAAIGSLLPTSATSPSSGLVASAGAAVRAAATTATHDAGPAATQLAQLLNRNLSKRQSGLASPGPANPLNPVTAPAPVTIPGAIPSVTSLLPVPAPTVPPPALPSVTHPAPTIPVPVPSVTVPPPAIPMTVPTTPIVTPSVPPSTPQGASPAPATLNSTPGPAATAWGTAVAAATSSHSSARRGAASSSTPGAPAAPTLTPTAGSGTSTNADPTASNTPSGPSLAVRPDSSLTNGEKVTVTGTGFAPHFQGALAECNVTAGAPTVPVYGYPFPVGCTNPLQILTTTDGSGHLTAVFTVRTGRLGPPATGIDSAGQAAAIPAGQYPCPPTAPQVAAGATCKIAYIDAAGERASAVITFASQTVAPATASTGGPSASPGPGSLPFSGFGLGLWHLDQLGASLVCVGLALVLVSARSRRRVGAASSA